MSQGMMMSLVLSAFGLVIGMFSGSIARVRNFSISWRASLAVALAFGGCLLDLHAHKVMPQTTTLHHVVAAAMMLMGSLVGSYVSWYYREFMRAVGMGDPRPERPGFCVTAFGALAGTYAYLSYWWVQEGFPGEAQVAAAVGVVCAIGWVLDCVGNDESLTVSIFRHCSAIGAGMAFGASFSLTLKGEPGLALVPISFILFVIAEVLVLRVITPSQAIDSTQQR